MANNHSKAGGRPTGNGGERLARIDKWLWAARIFKTRTLAADACKNGRVSVGGTTVKPSRMVKVGETVSVKKAPVTYSFRILQTIEMRVGARMLPDIYENVTTQDQYELLEMNRISGFIDRARGTGRPTKRERRQMDAFINPALEGNFGFADIDGDSDDDDFDDDDFDGFNFE